MFKFIHTSDWHLGQNFYGYDRSEEQSDFLRQLADIVRKHTPDALLVSGDIFHTAAPSNNAVNMYVNGLLDIHKACPDMKIIVIAGNHDSASRLDSDKRLWELAKVTVRGGISRNKDGFADLDSHIIKLGDKGLVAAVPFAYPTSFPLTETNADIERGQRQKAYFQALLDHANSQNNKNLPIVLMAHLTVKGGDFNGHDRNMAIESVDINTLGTGYDYAALGHIHRPQEVNQDIRVRYSGTPIPVSFDEQCEHSVSIVTIDDHGALPSIETKVIKNIKPLHTLPANQAVDFDTALEKLRQINPNERAYIRLNVIVERYLPEGAQERAAQAVADKQCRLCEIKKTTTATNTNRPSQMTVEEFHHKEPIDIANQYFIDQNGEPMNDQQREMFNYIYQSVKEGNRK